MAGNARCGGLADLRFGARLRSLTMAVAGYVGLLIAGVIIAVLWVIVALVVLGFVVCAFAAAANFFATLCGGRTDERSSSTQSG